MSPQESEKARRKLDALATWTPEALDEELEKWTPEEVTKFWADLEQPFQQMCRAFGIATQRQRVSLRGMRTHQQIKRLTVLQKHAQRELIY